MAADQPTFESLREESRLNRLKLKVRQQRQQLREAGETVNEGCWPEEIVNYQALLALEPGYGPNYARGAIPSTRADREDGRNRPIFQTEQDLNLIRGAARLLCATDEIAIGLLDKLTNYSIGTGFKYQATTKHGAPEGLLSAVQEVVDAFLEENRWQNNLDRELFQRGPRDGESFLGLWHIGGGHVQARTIEPEQVTGFGPNRQTEDWLGCENQSSWSFGIHTDQNDVVGTHGYFVQWSASDTDWDYFPGGLLPIIPPGAGAQTWCEHLKFNTDSTIKRGLSDFFTTENSLTRASRLLRNVAESGAAQASIAWIEQNAAGMTQAQQNAANAANAAKSNPRGNGLTPSERMHPSTILRPNAGREYKSGPGAEWAEEFLMIRDGSLRSAGSRWSMPEHLVSGDASNNNFASILVAGDPFVKATESRQQQYVEYFKRILWRVLFFAHRAGRFGQLAWPIFKRMVELKITPPQVAVRDQEKETNRRLVLHNAKIMSPQTWSAEEDLDFDQEQANLAAAPADTTQTVVAPKAADGLSRAAPQRSPAQAPAIRPPVPSESASAIEAVLSSLTAILEADSTPVLEYWSDAARDASIESRQAHAQLIAQSLSVATNSALHKPEGYHHVKQRLKELGFKHVSTEGDEHKYEHPDGHKVSLYHEHTGKGKNFMLLLSMQPQVASPGTSDRRGANLQSLMATGHGSEGAIEAGNVQEAFNEDEPRDDHGRWVPENVIAAAKSDPKIAAKLRSLVTKPEERDKLEKKLGNATAPAVSPQPLQPKAHEGPKLDVDKQSLADINKAWGTKLTADDIAKATGATKNANLEFTTFKDGKISVWSGPQGGELQDLHVLGREDIVKGAEPYKATEEQIAASKAKADQTGAHADESGNSAYLHTLGDRLNKLDVTEAQKLFGAGKRHARDAVHKDGTANVTNLEAGAIKLSICHDIAEKLAGKVDEHSLKALTDSALFMRNLGTGGRKVVSHLPPAEKAIAGVLCAWASDSSDGNHLSIAVQQSAARVTGMKADVYSSEKKDIRLAELPKADQQTLDAITSAIYERTQEQFKKAGVKELTLYRGFKHEDDETAPAWVKKASKADGRDVECKLKLNPLSSFSTSLRVARDFSAPSVQIGERYYGIITAKVPVENIFCTSITGPGCADEGEVVVLGKQKTGTVSAHDDESEG